MPFPFYSLKILGGTLLELFKELPDSWKSPLASQEALLHSISQSLENSPFIPKRSDVFRALEVSPLDVKVIIVGQDPYPGADHANGLAFSVKPDISPLPPTLRNIFKELRDDLGVVNTSGDLSAWRDQGVLLLNRVLTTSDGSSLAHANLGWEELTQEIIRIASQVEPVAILWGKKAQEIAGYFDATQVISSPHPSPLSAYRGFFGSKPFSQTNELLTHRNQSEIIWQTGER